jgi:hypothetical protein
MTDLLRFLLLLRGSTHENEKEEETSARAGAITTRSLLPSRSLSRSPPASGLLASYRQLFVDAVIPRI